MHRPVADVALRQVRGDGQVRGSARAAAARTVRPRAKAAGGAAAR